MFQQYFVIKRSNRRFSVQNPKEIKTTETTSVPDHALELIAVLIKCASVIIRLNARMIVMTHGKSTQRKAPMFGDNVHEFVGRIGKGCFKLEQLLGSLSRNAIGMGTRATIQMVPH